MIRHKHILLFSLITLLQSCCYSQPLRFGIQQINEYYSINDTILLEVKNASTHEYVFTISLMKLRGDEWVEIVKNIFDEKDFINQEYSIRISHRTNPRSIELINYPISDINRKQELSSGTYRFDLSYREYNIPDNETIILNSESFGILTSMENNPHATYEEEINSGSQNRN